MKFIADSMLGRLARWLRLLGYDTRYERTIEDSRLLRLAREEDRILLTRDTRLVRVRGLKDHLLITDNDPFEQLKTVLSAFGLSPRDSAEISAHAVKLSRCPVCNTPLEIVSRERARPHVPDYVYRTCESFKECPACQKYYWKGTHPGKLEQKLMEILEG